jgi:hypothetical protein
MKKLLIALLAVLGVAAFAPKAEAEQHVTLWNGHRYVAVPRWQVYGSHCEPRYRSDYYRSSKRYYSKPTRYYRSDDRCDRPVRYYQSSRPRFAISFGF